MARPTEVERAGSGPRTEAIAWRQPAERAMEIGEAERLSGSGDVEQQRMRRDHEQQIDLVGSGESWRVLRKCRKLSSRGAPAGIGTSSFGALPAPETTAPPRPTTTAAGRSPSAHRVSAEAPTPSARATTSSPTPTATGSPHRDPCRGGALDRPQRNQRAGAATGRAASSTTGRTARQDRPRGRSPTSRRICSTTPPSKERIRTCAAACLRTHQPAAGSGPVLTRVLGRRRPRGRGPAQLGHIPLVPRPRALGRTRQPRRADSVAVPPPGRARPARPGGPLPRRPTRSGGTPRPLRTRTLDGCWRWPDSRHPGPERARRSWPWKRPRPDPRRARGVGPTTATLTTCGTWSDFARRAPGIDWIAFFDAAGLAEPTSFGVWQPGALTGSAALVASRPVATWKDYLRFHDIDRHVDLLPRGFAEAARELRAAAARGHRNARSTRLPRPRGTQTALGDDEGSATYAERHFPAGSKASVQAIVANVRAAFRSESRRRPG